MTFDDDFVQVQFAGGLKRIYCNSIGVEWPPPETLEILGFECKLLRHSQITDEQRETMEHVCRGAEYEVTK